MTAPVQDARVDRAEVPLPSWASEASPWLPAGAVSGKRCRLVSADYFKVALTAVQVDQGDGTVTIENLSVELMAEFLTGTAGSMAADARLLASSLRTIADLLDGVDQ